MARKTIIGLTAGIIGIAATAGVALSNINTAPEMSDLMIKNLEVLSQNENGGLNGKYDYVFYGKKTLWIPELNRYEEVTVRICEGVGDNECNVG
jgi:hypothetical protein